MPSNSNVTVNRNYKDSIFRLLFSESKENALSLYNAVNGTHYTNAEDLVVTNLEDAFYVSIKNDAAFVFNKHLNLYEHQSTINMNMPLRGLFYITAMYRGMIDPNSLYSERIATIPAPQFIVFYNGRNEDLDDIVKLKLSDMFETPDTSGEYEWTATMININHGHSESIMSCCKLLNGYAILMGKIRFYFDENRNRMPYKEALDLAIERSVEECIKEDILKDFLEKYRKEVLEMSIFEFSEEDYQKLYKDAGRKEGREEGRAEERIHIICQMIKSGFSKEQLLTTFTEEEYDVAIKALAKAV